MIRQSMLISLGLLVGLTLGCEKKQTPPAAPSGSAETAVNEAVSQTEDAQETATAKMQDAAAQVKADAEKAMTESSEAVQSTAAEATAAVTDATDKAAAQAGAMKQAAETTVEAGTQEEMVAKAIPMIDQAMNYIKENKLDLAEKTLEQLDKISASLPEAIQTQIANAHKALDVAKGSNSLGGVTPPGK